jgi:hypothetical protein
VDNESDRFSDFDIEILHSVERHRAAPPKPRVGTEPAGQDLQAPLAPWVSDSTAPIAAEGQFFLDNVIALFGRA